MTIVLAARRYGPYTSVCQLRAPGDAGGRCDVSAIAMRSGRRWARCKGVRSNLKRVAVPAAQPLSPLLAPPLPRREATFTQRALWEFLGRPGWKLWAGLLERAGVPRRRKSGKRSLFTHAECRRVMETRYRELGEQRLKRNG